MWEVTECKAFTLLSILGSQSIQIVYNDYYLYVFLSRIYYNFNQNCRFTLDYSDFVLKY